MPEAHRTQPVRRRQNRNPAPSFARILAFLVVLGLCVAAALAAGVFLALPPLVTERFGPPAPTLDLLQQVIYGVRMSSNADALLIPVEISAPERDFKVELGETVDSVAFRLEQDRLIANADTFRTYLVYSGLDRGVQAGDYRLSPAMNALEIARKLQDPLPGAVQFNILPGWRAEEIAAALPTSGLAIDPQQFLALVRNPPTGLRPAWAADFNSLEGVLLPESYEAIPRETTAEGLIRIFLQRFESLVTPDVQAGFTAQGLTLSEAVTLASIVQREAVQADEQPRIAGVFHNRLAAGMRLESDPTVQYAVGYDAASGSWWKVPLTSADLGIDSPYNTYQVYRLPPGAIANPGMGALRAVAFPEQTEFYYFRALCDGSGRHAFAVTYDQHIQNACP